MKTVFLFLLLLLGAPTLRAQNCKKGIRCGNTCIAANKTCHIAPAGSSTTSSSNGPTVALPTSQRGLLFELATSLIITDSVIADAITAEVTAKRSVVGADSLLASLATRVKQYRERIDFDAMHLEFTNTPVVKAVDSLISVFARAGRIPNAAAEFARACLNVHHARVAAGTVLSGSGYGVPAGLKCDGTATPGYETVRPTPKTLSLNGCGVGIPAERVADCRGRFDLGGISAVGSADTAGGKIVRAEFFFRPFDYELVNSWVGFQLGPEAQSDQNWKYWAWAEFRLTVFRRDTTNSERAVAVLEFAPRK